MVHLLSYRTSPLGYLLRSGLEKVSSVKIIRLSPERAMLLTCHQIGFTHGERYLEL